MSIWTTAGRMAGIPFRCSDAQYEQLREYRCGESDLLHRDGKWYFYATCDIYPNPTSPRPDGFIGVDLGIANIATTDDGTRHSGKHLNRHRHRGPAPAPQTPGEGHQVRETAPAQEVA